MEYNFQSLRGQQTFVYKKRGVNEENNLNY